MEELQKLLETNRRLQKELIFNQIQLKNLRRSFSKLKTLYFRLQGQCNTARDENINLQNENGDLQYDLMRLNDQLFRRAHQFSRN